MQLALIILFIGLSLLAYRVTKEIREAGNLFVIVSMKNVLKKPYPLWKKILNLYLVFEISPFILIGLLLTIIGIFVLCTELLK